MLSRDRRGLRLLLGALCPAMQCLELAVEHTHPDDVPVAAILEIVLSITALQYEAALAVAGLRALVELEDTQRHLVQVHLVEGESQQRQHRVGAVAVGPVRLVADHDAELGGTVLRTAAVQPAVAYMNAVLRLDRQAQVGITVAGGG